MLSAEEDVALRSRRSGKEPRFLEKTSTRMEVLVRFRNLIE